MFAFVGEAAANHCCDAVDLIEKTSMEKLQHVGLVNDQNHINFANAFKCTFRCIT